MKTPMAYKAIKNMVFSAMVLIPIQLNVGTLPATNTELKLDNTDKVVVSDETPPSAMPNVVLLDLDEKYCDINCFLSRHDDTIKFMSRTFGVTENDILEDLNRRNSENAYDEYNIGALKDKKGNLKKYRSFEEGFIEYLFDFTRSNKNLVDNTIKPYTGESEYVENLIRYFTTIYDDVDYLTAISIGAAESGYYKVTYMLKCNNIFGGMGRNGLIKYKNIEYGVLSYVRMLSLNYYQRGMNTLDSIGRVYCPTRDSNGNKVASSHWKNLVNSAKAKYKNTTNDIQVANLIND